MAHLVMPQLDVLLHSSIALFPYGKAFAEAERDPMAVMHTSGSTGIPKPIVSPQGLWSIVDEYRTWPEFHGTKVSYPVWAEKAKRIFLSFPFFHAGGMQVFTNMTIGLDTPCVLPIADRPMTGELVLETLLHSGSDAAMLPSSILEELSQSEEGIQTLQKLAFVGFGGGTDAIEQF